MTPSFDNIFSKVKQNTNKAAQQVNLAAKITKLKVEIATQKSEKERHLQSIGSKTYAIFCTDKSLDGQKVQEEIATELSLIDRIDDHIEDLQSQIAQLKAEFRDSEKDVVDASAVQEEQAPDEGTPSQ